MKIKAPVAKRMREQITLHNETRTDEYAWLRDPNWQLVMQDPEALRDDIREYLEQENAYTKSVMQETEKFQATLFEEMKNRLKQDDSTVPSKDGEYYYYIRYEIGAEHPCYCRYKGNNSNQEEVLLDANFLSKQFHYFDLVD